MADRPIWKLKFQDPTWDEPRIYDFDPQELLGVTELRQFKSWFRESPELGRYLNFIQTFAQGDPDAAVCALWLVRRAAGEPEVPEPLKMPNFPMGDFFHDFIPADEEVEADPLNTGSPTLASTAIPTPSEPGISPSSDTSADSPPET